MTNLGCEREKEQEWHDPHGLSTSRGKEKSYSSWGSSTTVRRVTSKAMVSWPTVSDRHVELLDAGRMQRQTAEAGGV